MKAILGLGNPGEKYCKNRHNIGFMMVDYLSNIHNIKINNQNEKSLYGKGFINNEEVLLIKPTTFMNTSGEAISELKNQYDIEEFIIIYDDLSLDLNKVRIRTKGSAGGHNGIKSIIEHLDSKKFKRIKYGIGEPINMDIIDYVLGDFSETDLIDIEENKKNINDIVQLLLDDEVEKAMNNYN